MARSLWIAAIACLSCAFALNFLTSVSLPFLVGLDITRVHFGNRVATNTPGINQIRVRFKAWILRKGDADSFIFPSLASGL